MFHYHYYFRYFVPERNCQGLELLNNLSLFLGLKEVKPNIKGFFEMGPRSYLFLFPLFYSTTVKPTHGCQCSDIIDPLILIFDFNILPSKSRLLNLFFIFFFLSRARLWYWLCGNHRHFDFFAANFIWRHYFAVCFPCFIFFFVSLFEIPQVWRCYYA